jgi:hypothetical protein
MGVGHVGLRVARTPTGMGFEVVGIDHKPSPMWNGTQRSRRTADYRRYVPRKFPAGLPYAQSLSPAPPATRPTWKRSCARDCPPI